MRITEIKIRKTFKVGRVRAIVSIVLDDLLAVNNIRIIQGDEKLFIVMPDRERENGEHFDIVHPISEELRSYFEKAIIGVYKKYISKE